MQNDPDISQQLLDIEKQKISLLEEKISLEQQRNKLEEDRIDLSQQLLDLNTNKRTTERKTVIQKVLADYSALVVAIIALLGSIFVQFSAGNNSAQIQKQAASDQFRMEVAQLIMDSNNPGAASNRLQFLATVFPTQLAGMKTDTTTTANLTSIDNKTLLDLLTLIYDHPDHGVEIIENWNTLRSSPLAVPVLTLTPQLGGTQAVVITVCGNPISIIPPIGWKETSFLGAITTLSNQPGSSLCHDGKISDPNEIVQLIQLLNSNSEPASFKNAWQKYLKGSNSSGQFPYSDLNERISGNITPTP